MDRIDAIDISNIDSSSQITTTPSQSPSSSTSAIWSTETNNTSKASQETTDNTSKADQERIYASFTDNKSKASQEKEGVSSSVGNKAQALDQKKEDVPSPLHIAANKCLKFVVSKPPALSATEEATMLAILKNKESINRILGKSVGKSVSGAFRYYIAICHLSYGRTKILQREGAKLLLHAAQTGCADAWWELSRRCKSNCHPFEPLEYIMRGYILGQPDCISHISADFDSFLVSVGMLIPVVEEAGQFVQHFLLVIKDGLEKGVELDHYTRMLLVWDDIEIPVKDRDICGELLYTILMKGERVVLYDTIYAALVDKYDLSMTLEDID